MHITKKDIKKYILFSLIFIWLIMFFHLWYLYLQQSNQQQAIKWWVLLEWIVWNAVNPLPYLWNWYYSRYVQSLLYKWCLNNDWNSDLCNVKTSDHKTYFVTLTWNNYWTSWRKITLDDIYFTYNDIIKNNSLNLDYPIVNDLKNVVKDWNGIKVVFNQASVNNNSFFQNYILPENILKNADKNFYISNYSQRNINSTCVSLDLKSNFKSNLILDYSKCPNYYINKYQFNLFQNIKQLSKFWTWKTNIDIYNWYTNIDGNKYLKHNINLKVRYAMFWNTKKQTNEWIKTYLSKQILYYLKKDFTLQEKVNFIWYWLFVLPKINDTNTWFKLKLWKNSLDKQKKEFRKKIYTINNDIYLYKQWENNIAYVDNIKKYLIVKWTLLTWKYDKIWVSYKTGNEYILKSYNWTKNIKYVISEKFWNIKKWENNYKIYGYKKNKKVLLDTIVLYYKDIIYPKFKINYPDFTLVYLNNWLIAKIGDSVYNTLVKIYPWQIRVKKVWKQEYNDILASWKYDLIISSISFRWKDVSYIFKTDKSTNNPSLFKNSNFASLINQDFLAPMNLKKKVFSELNKIYQANIPVVFIWNEKINLYVNKKYNIPNLDYSSFKNRDKLLKSIVLTKIKKTNLNKVSFSWFLSFLRWLVIE